PDAPPPPPFDPLSLHGALPISRRAGIDAAESTVAPGDRLLRRLTGARKPPGVPVPPPATVSPAESSTPRRPGRPRDTPGKPRRQDRKSTRLNSSHVKISYAVFC